VPGSHGIRVNTVILGIVVGGGNILLAPQLDKLDRR
jgi:hypothetical protein